jgi:hypothetical protein
VQRIWRCEGLKVPARQPRRGRLWLADGSCIRLRPERPHHGWAYDFVEDRTRGRVGRSECCAWWTSSRARRWRSGWRAG